MFRCQTARLLEQILAPTNPNNERVDTTQQGVNAIEVLDLRRCPLSFVDLDKQVCSMLLHFVVKLTVLVNPTDQRTDERKDVLILGTECLRTYLVSQT